MQNYRYNATDTEGRWVSGEVEAPSHAEAQDLLKSRGLKIESMIEADDRPGEGRLSRAEMVELVEQIASLTRAGVPLPSGLRAAAEEMTSSRLRKTFIDLAGKLDSGASLVDSLASHGDRFPAEVRGLILAGSKTGRLADLLGEFVRSANLGAELRRMFWSTLLYPTLTLLAILIVIRFVCAIGITSIESVMQDFGVNRPGNTQLLGAFTQLFAEHGTALLALAILGPLAVLAWIRYTNSPIRRRAIACGLPLVGPILRYCSLTDFCHRLAMFLEAELPLPLAFELAGSSVGDAEVAEACHRMGSAVERGAPLSTAVELWEAIPAGLGQLFAWSENQQSLPEALHLAGDMFETRARAQANFARSVLSTVMLLLIVWGITFAVAALYLPMITLIARLSG